MLLAPDAFGIEKRVEVFGFRFVAGEIFRRLICNNCTAPSAQNFDLQCASLHVFVMTGMKEYVEYILYENSFFSIISIKLVPNEAEDTARSYS